VLAQHLVELLCILALTVESFKGDETCEFLGFVSTPLELIGRPAEFQRIVTTSHWDGDLLIAGFRALGGARWSRTRQLREIGAIVLGCIRATDGERFVRCWPTLLARCSQARRLLMIQSGAQPACEVFCLQQRTVPE